MPFESNPPPDAMPDLDLEAELPLTEPEITAGSFRSGEVDEPQNEPQNEQQ